jgi:hypothetical protein
MPYFSRVLKRIWKKAVRKPNSVYCHEICLKGLGTTDRISARVTIFGVET